MKKFRKFFLILTFFVSSPSFAANGSALIPHFITDTSASFYSYFYITNITSETIEVKITFFNANGDVITDTGNSHTTGYFRAADFDTYIEPAADHSVVITLNAQQTFSMALQSYISNKGYGKIEWTQENSQTRTAVIAYGRTERYEYGRHQALAIPINNGVEF